MDQPKLYPLILSPAVKNYIWGGQRLNHLMETDNSMDQKPVAEIWAVHGNNIIKNGFYAGYSLNQLMLERPEELIGITSGRNHEIEFPILIKILDCQQWLSIQVHPDNQLAIKLEGPQYSGKTETWFFMDSEPGSQIYAGTKTGITQTELKNAIESNNILDVLQMHEIKKNDFILIKAGVVHALGPGLTVYELQQNSDLTYRVYDWDRPITAGRSLHIDKSCLAAKNIQTTPRNWQPKGKSNSYAPLIQCPFFKLELINNLEDTVNIDTGTSNFQAFTVSSGKMILQSEDLVFNIKQFETILIPASLGKFQLSGEFSVLRASPCFL